MRRRYKDALVETLVKDWILHLPLNLITASAKDNGLPVSLVAAIVQQESSGDNKRVRYEPNYPYLLTPEIFAKRNLVTVASEIQMQKISWGLMQVMGSTAREMGFDKPLQLVAHPKIGLDVGCKYLKKLINKYGSDDAISSYNQGNPRKNTSGLYVNQEYVDSVLNYFKIFESTFS